MKALMAGLKRLFRPKNDYKEMFERQTYLRLADRQRLRWRATYQSYRFAAERGKQVAHVGKLLAAKARRPEGDLPGYVSFEVTNLIQWLVKGNKGAYALLEEAAQALVAYQLREVVFA